MAISQQQKEDILALTVATFNAAPSAAILQDFAKEIEAGMTTQQLADILVATDEFKEGVLKGAVTNEEITGALLKNFGLAAGNTDATSPDAQAEAFIFSELEAGKSISTVIVEAATYLLGTPAEAFQPTADLFKNKITMADVYSREGKGETLDEMQNVLIPVTPAGPKTEAEAEALLGPVTTDPVNLTTGVDSLKGTTGNDIFNGVVDTIANGGTLNNGDSIDGGAGNDTANFTLTGAGFPAGATITNVEKVFFKNVTGANDTLDVSNITGATELWSSGSVGKTILTLNNIQSNAALGLSNAVGGGGLAAAQRLTQVNEIIETIDDRLA